MSPLNLVESDEKPNIWQMKKKERKDFRRQQDENYDLVHDLKKLYETIRRCVSLKVVRLQTQCSKFPFQFFLVKQGCAPVLVWIQLLKNKMWIQMSFMTFLT